MYCKLSTLQYFVLLAYYFSILYVLLAVYSSILHILLFLWLLGLYCLLSRVTWLSPNSTQITLCTMDNLIGISMDGDVMDKCDPTPAVLTWFSMGNRKIKLVLPYPVLEDSDTNFSAMVCFHPHFTYMARLAIMAHSCPYIQACCLCKHSKWRVSKILTVLSCMMVLFDCIVVVLSCIVVVYECIFTASDRLSP